MSKTPAARFDLWTSEVHKFSAFRTCFLGSAKCIFLSTFYLCAFWASKSPNKRTLKQSTTLYSQPNRDKWNPLQRKESSFFFFFFLFNLGNFDLVKFCYMLTVSHTLYTLFWNPVFKTKVTIAHYVWFDWFN